jgi:hypothetical protein
MLQINEEFLESKTAQCESREPLAMPSQGLVAKRDTVAESNPKPRPRRVRSTPMWQAALLAR